MVYKFFYAENIVSSVLVGEKTTAPVPPVVVRSSVRLGAGNTSIVEVRQHRFPMSIHLRVMGQTATIGFAHLLELLDAGRKIQAVIAQ